MTTIQAVALACFAFALGSACFWGAELYSRKRLPNRARTWREREGYSGKGGFVLFYQGEIIQRVLRLPDPGRFMPGYLAVDEHGNIFETIPGNPKSRWISGSVAWQKT